MSVSKFELLHHPNLNPSDTMLRKARLEKELSLRELSEKSGVSKSTISKIETGTRNPSAYVADKLARVLECDAGNLFTI